LSGLNSHCGPAFPGRRLSPGFPFGSIHHYTVSCRHPPGLLPFELDNRETIHSDSEPFPFPTESGKIHHGHELGIPSTQGQFGLLMEKRYGFHAPATGGGQKQILARFFLPDQQLQLQLSRNTSEEIITLQTIRTFLPSPHRSSPYRRALLGRSKRSSVPAALKMLSPEKNCLSVEINVSRRFLRRSPCCRHRRSASQTSWTNALLT
jgi:hypothetical protein